MGERQAHAEIGSRMLMDEVTRHSVDKIVDSREYIGQKW